MDTLTNLVKGIGNGFRLPFVGGAGASRPQISFVAMFNPELAKVLDEKQVLFFHPETPLPQQLNTVGLLRSVVSLARELGGEGNSYNVDVDGGLLLVCELETDCFLALHLNVFERGTALLQAELLVRRWHRFSKLLGLDVAHFWLQFMENFNRALAVPYGPPGLNWPNCMNHMGVFGLCPHGYRKSLVRIPDSLRPDMEAFGECVVANFDRSVPKKYGLVHGDNVAVYEFIEALHFNGSLVSGDMLANMYDFQVPEEGIAPISTTVSGLKYLGEWWQKEEPEPESGSRELPLSKPLHVYLDNGIVVAAWEPIDFKAVLEVVTEAIQISNGDMALTNSISSLKLHQPVDNDFFFIVYNLAEDFYQTSLPLPRHPTEPGVNLIHHLHDQLAHHFLVQGAASIFQKDNAVSEHLHKFAGAHSDWLFYFIRHKQQAIVIIRNYNAKKHKTAEERGYLRQLAESVHDYANLGFLDNLGDDVKVWLEGYTS